MAVAAHSMYYILVAVCKQEAASFKYSPTRSEWVSQVTTHGLLYRALYLAGNTLHDILTRTAVLASAACDALLHLMVHGASQRMCVGTELKRSPSIGICTVQHSC